MWDWLELRDTQWGSKAFVGVAKHYGVAVDPCPPYRPQRKGVVEKAIHYISQRWWRTVVVNSLASAQQSLDRFCVTVGDTRPRGEATVGDLADSEPLLELPPLAYPAEGTLARKVAANGLVSVWGNRYSVPPGVIDAEVTVRWRHPHRPRILLQRHHHHPRRRTRHLPAHSLRHSRLEKELRPTPCKSRTSTASSKTKAVSKTAGAGHSAKPPTTSDFSLC